MIEYKCDHCKAVITDAEPHMIAVEEWRRNNPQSAAVQTEHFCPSCAPRAGGWWDRKLEILADVDRKLAARLKADLGDHFKRSTEAVDPKKVKRKIKAVK